MLGSWVRAPAGSPKTRDNIDNKNSCRICGSFFVGFERLSVRNHQGTIIIERRNFSHTFGFCMEYVSIIMLKKRYDPFRCKISMKFFKTRDLWKRSPTSLSQIDRSDEQREKVLILYKKAATILFYKGCGFSYSERESNPYGHFCPRDFKSRVSTYSTIRAPV